MKRFLCTLVALGLVGASPAASTSCRWFGTQLECELGGRQLSIGTQAAAEPGYVGAFRVRPLHGGDGLFDQRPVASGGTTVASEEQNNGGTLDAAGVSRENGRQSSSLRWHIGSY